MEEIILINIIVIDLKIREIYITKSWKINKEYSSTKKEKIIKISSLKKNEKSRIRRK